MEMNKLDIAARLPAPLTIADLDAFPDDDGNRYELIGGELFVSRAPGIPHQRVLHNLQLELGQYLKANPVGILVPGAGAIFSDYDAVIPDLAFVRHERWDQVVTGEKFTGALDLVIEILSPGTQNRQRDLAAKRRLYEEYGVHEYWIVDAENLSVLVLRLAEESFREIATLNGNDALDSPLLPGFQLIVSTIFNV
jgi:Uma2 family endonuclease